MKYAPRKVYIKESGIYVELSYTDFCRRREADQRYMDKLFIPVQGCLLEVVREQCADFYKDKERWRYLKKLDTKNGLLSLLSGSKQALVKAIFFEELSEREVGLRLGITQSVVNKRKAKILAKLRKMIEN